MKNNFYRFSKKQKQCFFLGVFALLFSIAFGSIAIVDFQKYWFAMIAAVGFFVASLVVISRMLYALGHICFNQTGIWSQIGNRKYRFMEWSKIKKASLVTDTDREKYLVLSKNPLIAFGGDRIFGGILPIFEDLQTLIVPAKYPLIVHCEDMLKFYGISLEVGGLDPRADTKEMVTLRKKSKKSMR